MLDPDETLDTIRDLFRREKRRNLPEDRVALLDDIAAHFEALDSYLTSGGFLPDAWESYARE